MKKFFLVILTILLALSLFSCSGTAPETGDFECEFDTDAKTVTVTGYKGSDDEITIPKNFGKYTVTSIGRNAFKENYDLSSVTLPETLKTIGTSAFELCVGIEKITLPESLEVIDNTAFANCRGLEEINIPKNVKTIGICAFTGCTSLESITVSEGNPNYSSDDRGALFDKAKTELIQYPLGSDRKTYDIPKSVKTIGGYAFEKTQKLETLTAESVETVKGYAFQGSSIKEATFGNSLTIIDNFAFNESRLNVITIGNNVKGIGNSSFSWCTSLKGISLPETLETIGTSAFYMCTSITKFEVNENNPVFSADEKGVLFDKQKQILLYYPNSNEAEEYIIPSTVTTIAARAFSPTLSLKKVTLPDSVETIEEYAFAQCSNLKDVIYEGTSPTNIAENAFEK